MVVRLGAAWLLLTALPALAGVATVLPDRTQIAENESLSVVFTYSEELREEPDFDVLEQDFDIIGQNRRSNLQSINGRFSYELSWTLTLMPRRSGVLTILPVDFDGTRSEAVSIEVTPAPVEDARKLGDLALEVELTPAQGYVQGQFIYTQRIYHRGWLVNGDLTDPDFGDADAVVKQLDQVRRYSLFRDGDQYQVYEQSYLVFPQRSGELNAGQAVFTGKLREPGRAQRLMRVSAEPASATVLPVPDAFAGVAFLPAADLTIEEEWPESGVAFEQGRPVTRVLRVSVKGLLSSQLPEIEFPEMDGIRTYVDKAERHDSFGQDGVTGVVEQTVALVPQQGGELTLPAVRIDWWDTVSRKRRTAEVNARTVFVQGAPPTAAAVTPGAAQADGVAPRVITNAGPWRAATVTLFGLWLATLLVWFWRSRARVPSAPARASGGRRSRFRARAELKKACLAGDAPSAAAALLALGRAVLPEDSPRSLDALRARANAALTKEIDRLVQACYGADSQWRDPEALWRAVDDWRPVDASATATQKNPGLADL